MAFLQLNWFSDALGKHTTTWVLYPETGTPPFPTFYLLHGLSDDHTTWMRRTRIEIYSQNYPLAIVMPDGGRGFYTNQIDGPQGATHLGEELPNFIERMFNVQRTREGRCIGGLSMGGYGALHAALAYPDRFISATSHSGGLMAGTKKHPETERVRIFGKDPIGTDHDLITLAKAAQAKGKLPAIRIDCGDKDFMLEDNRKLHKALLDLKVPHEYEEFPGDHNWEYWNLHVQEALEFHSKQIRKIIG